MTVNKEVVRFFEEGHKKGFDLMRLSDELYNNGFDDYTVTCSLNSFLKKRDTRKKLGIARFSSSQIGLIIGGSLALAGIVMIILI